MKGLSKLSYIVIEAKDISQWNDFADCLGLSVEKDLDGSLNLRANENVYSLKVVEGEKDDVIALGWEFHDLDSLNTYTKQLMAKGYNINVNSDLAVARNTESLYVLNDPNNIQHEFVYGLAKAINEINLNTTKFITDNGIGHALVSAKDKAESLKFYQDIGLAVTDTIQEEVMPGMVIDATFMHVNDRHHSFAFAPMPPDSKNVHHIMLECETIDEVGQAYEKCIKHQDNIVLDFGKHPNDEVFSFYVKTPSGFAIEIGTGGKKINYENWVPTSYEKLSSWGHKPKL